MVVGRIPSSWAKPKYLGEALVVGQGLVRGYSSDQVPKCSKEDTAGGTLAPRELNPYTTMTTRNWDCLRDFEKNWIESFTVSGLLSSILTNLQASSKLGSPSDMGFFLVRGYQWDQSPPKMFQGMSSRRNAPAWMGRGSLPCRGGTYVWLR